MNSISLLPNDVRRGLVHALTAYDRAQEQRAAKSKHGYHNVYALAQYLARVDEILDDIADGADVREAIIAAFTGSVLKAALKPFPMLAPPTKDELTGAGKYSYQKASKRSAP